MDTQAPKRIPAIIEGLFTTVAIGVLAYITAAIVHEAGGHGAACVALGGHLVSLSSLFPQCTLQRPIIAIAGPLANILCGLVAAAFAGRFARHEALRHVQLYCWLVAAYNLFFGTGYLVFSGITGHGDWIFLFGIAGVGTMDRVVLIVAGIAALAASMRVLMATRPRLMHDNEPLAQHDLTLTIYVAASIVSVAAAALDPAGLRAVLALPPAAPFAGLGLLWLRHVALRRAFAPRALAIGVSCHRGWLVAGTIGVALFIAVLGPGIRFT
ncbi:MAG: hypothetical protein WB784_12935 [Rhodanobacteraceae bacterium]